MIADGANETDVREELAMPFLSLLGYERGTENEILREFSLRYERIFLGRKKPNDPPIRGRADYILSVTGAGRWVLEIKAPKEKITQEVIEQAISYARHPEISGKYVAVMNGKRIVVFHDTQHSSDDPIVDLDIQSAEELANKLSGLLGPSAIRRDCTPPVVDLGVPLSDGFRSSADIRGGSIDYLAFEWECSYPMPDAQKLELDETCRRMTGYRSNIIGGRVWRDESSRIKAKLQWSIPNDELLKFAQDKNLLDAEYVSLDEKISNNAANPSVFDVVGALDIEKGEPIFDALRWKTQVAGIDLTMDYRGQALGCIADDTFSGNFQAEYFSTSPVIPRFEISFFGMGNFTVIFDQR